MVIINGCSEQILSMFPTEYIDLIVCSPPYKDIDNYSEDLIKNVFTEVFRVLKKDHLLFLNFGHLAEDKSRPFKVCLNLEEIGFKLQETFVWKKHQYRPLQGKKRVNNLTEFIFMFSKGKMTDLDRMAIGIPYDDVRNAKRYGKNQNLRCQGNFWSIPYKTVHSKAEKLHNDRFPVQLPLNCLKLANLPKNSIVLDCFNGSGTTGVAAKQLGLRYIGIEKDFGYCKISKDRLK